jgi:predicted Fe-S protein YdhL (DUF1289 family)
VTDEIWHRDEIESPCVKICMIHPEAGICVGCYRTADEIARWSAMPVPERRAIMAELAERAPRIRRRGGRGRRIRRD